MPDEDKNSRGSLVLDFRKWWLYVKTIYQIYFNSVSIFVYLYICHLKMTSTNYLASFPLSIEEFAN